MTITHYIRIRNYAVLRDGHRVLGGSAPLDNFLTETYSSLRVDYPKFYKMDNLSKLGFLGAEMLLADRPITGEYPSSSVALVLSNATSSLDTDIRFAETMKGLPSPSLFVYTLPNIVAGEICIRHKITGENAFFVSGRFEADWMVDYVNSLVNANADVKACIAGWIDVMGEHHDVFLYLLERNRNPAMPHTAAQLTTIYEQ